MREIRPSGSEGGGAGTNRPSLPLFIERPYGTKFREVRQPPKNDVRPCATLNLGKEAEM
jgi:hypothetical protein